MGIVDSDAESITQEQKVLFQNKINELQRLFKEAENQIIITSRISEEVSAPAINQLRYAGSHLVSSYDCHAKEALDNLDNSIKHCKRAVYDAIEARCFYFLSSFENFKNDYRKTVITDVVANYIDIIRLAKKIQNCIRSVNSEAGKEKYFQELKGYLASFEECCFSLEVAREELNKKNRLQLLKTLFALVPIFGVLISLASFVLYNLLR